MDGVGDSVVSRDVLSEFAESGLEDSEAFASALNVPTEWVEYWLALATVKRQCPTRASSWTRD